MNVIPQFTQYHEQYNVNNIHILRTNTLTTSVSKVLIVVQQTSNYMYTVCLSIKFYSQPFFRGGSHSFACYRSLNIFQRFFVILINESFFAPTNFRKPSISKISRLCKYFLFCLHFVVNEQCNYEVITANLFIIASLLSITFCNIISHN